MKGLIIFSCVVALTVADPGLIAGHAVAPAVAASVSSQYHAQDELGQYSYGYAGGPSAKQEVRTADGITRGGYSYIDGHGLVQSASYVSDPVNGFRVAATNLPVGPGAPAAPVAVAAAPVAIAAAPAPVAVAAAPAVTVNSALPVAAHVGYAAAHVGYAGPAAPLAYAAAPGHLASPIGVIDTPEVAAAKIAHATAHAEAKGHLLGRKKRGVFGGVAAPAVAAYAAPAAIAHTAVAAPAVAAYAAPAVAIAPARSFAYSTASVHAHPVAYAAPAVAVHAAPAVAAHVAGPVAYAAPGAPLALAAAPGHLASPIGVIDTPEVAAAKVAHAAAHLEAKARLGRKKRGIAGPAVAAYAAPAAFAHTAVAAPAVAAYAAPAVAAYAAPAVAVAPSRSFAYSTVSAATVPVAAPAVAAYAAPAYAAPAVAAHAIAAPAVAAHSVVAAPAVGIATSASSQYQAQDTLGQYSYGYSDINSAKAESRAFDGSTHGSYSYVDGAGVVQSVKYHADALGFRVAGTNIPVAP